MIVLRCLDNLGQIRIRTVETTTFEKNLLRTDWLLFWQGAAGQAGLPAILTCFFAGRQAAVPGGAEELGAAGLTGLLYLQVAHILNGSSRSSSQNSGFPSHCRSHNTSGMPALLHCNPSASLLARCNRTTQKLLGPSLPLRRKHHHLCNEWPSQAYHITHRNCLTTSLEPAEKSSNRSKAGGAPSNMHSGFCTTFCRSAGRPAVAWQVLVRSAKWRASHSGRAVGSSRRQGASADPFGPCQRNSWLVV